MEILQEIIFLVTKPKIQAIKLISMDEDSKLTQLYEGISQNQYPDDEAAVQAVFGSDSQNSNYRKLKSVLKKRLINYLFLVDLNETHYNDRQRAYYECHKNWAAVKMLLGKNARKTAIDLSSRILRQARKFEFTELVLDVSRILRLHFGAREGNLKKYEHYNDLFNQYEQLWSLENKAEQLYTDLVIRYVTTKATNTVVSKKAHAYYESISDSLANYDSYRLWFCAFLIRVIEKMSLNKYTETIRIAQDAIDYFESKNYQATAPVLIFSYQQLVCYTQNKQYIEGKRVAERCFELTEEGSFNWFKYHESYFFLAMHSEEYQEAWRIFETTIQHKRFSYLPPHVIESWKLFEAYLHYLILLERVSSIEGKEAGGFRLGKFLNEIPIYTKDKRGMNIPVLLIQILFLIHQGKFETATDRIESVRKYASRYLVQDSTFRSNCFIKMLTQLPSAHYHRKGAIRKAEKYLKKLKEIPLDMANQAHEIEIIPYERLWQFVLDSLSNKFRRSGAKQTTVRE